MPAPLPVDLKEPPRRWWAMLAAIGPGIIISGSVLGAGELINTPEQAVRFGFVLLWVVIISCVIKFFLQVEIGRHCLVHRRSTIEAFNHLPGPKWRGTSWLPLVYMIGFTVSLMVFFGILKSVAEITDGVWRIGESHAVSVGWWCVILAVVTQAVLWNGRYRELEALVAVLVIGFSLSVVVAVILLQSSPAAISAEDIRLGLSFSLGDHPRAAAFAVISLLGGLGTTANELYIYPYWVLEKGYAKFTGEPNDPGWEDRLRGWIRVLKLDTFICTLLATVVTAAYYLLGAALLHGKPRGQNVAIIDQFSTIFTETFGEWTYGLFMFGAFCTLWSTLVVGIASTGRLWSDLLTSLSFVSRDNLAGQVRTRRIVQSLYLLASLAGALLLTNTPAFFVILGQYVNGLANSLLVMFAICWVAFATDRRFRMNRFSMAMLLGSVFIIVACLAIGVLHETGLMGQPDP